MVITIEYLPETVVVEKQVEEEEVVLDLGSAESQVNELSKGDPRAEDSMIGAKAIITPLAPDWVV
jgi:hypothetical protein